MKIKSGDFVEINGEEVWVCNCKEAPLNGALSKKCMFCNMRRPTKHAPDLKPACPTCKDTGSVEYPCPNCRPSKTASSW